MAEPRKTPPRKKPAPRKRTESAVERRTAGRRTLRAVGPEDAAKPRDPAPEKPKTITQAATDGTHLELLVAMQTRIAQTVESPSCPPRDLASLTKRLTELAKEIEAIKAAAKQEAADDDAASTPDESLDASAF